jgi:hypothetical protein
LCHIIGGSALIDLPLVAYRIHESNYYASGVSLLSRAKHGHSEGTRRVREDMLRTMDFWLSRAADFHYLLGERTFWGSLKALADMQSKTLFASPETRHLLTSHYGDLKEYFGEHAIMENLVQLMPRNPLIALVSDLYRLNPHSSFLRSWLIKKRLRRLPSILLGPGIGRRLGLAKSKKSKPEGSKRPKSSHT